MKNISIKITNATLRYPISHPRKIKDFLSKYSLLNDIQALTNINLHILKGERVGLIGPNGAGKSTLLKMMAKIYQPTEGQSLTIGRVCPLFELATGFEMEMSGWDNIRIRALLLGMCKAEINEKIKEIADFTELGYFLDYPVRTYSSGMFIRLAFAISTAIVPEVLLLDEVVGAGDLAFANKAKKRMQQFIEQGHILVLSTHSPDILEKFCERTIWLDHGVIKADGPTTKVWQEYVNFVK